MNLMQNVIFNRNGLVEEMQEREDRAKAVLEQKDGVNKETLKEETKTIEDDKNDKVEKMEEPKNKKKTAKKDKQE